ncbi:DUF421 domain-containing protein [Bacillus benzoevorans]|uniref:Uncharacterized membrane protein YcaP (DUF421 family) n=1 Tax=Bacillus benzoevorans TaxID=1456 RepID=A0A7X0HS68_9BACI|nr:DUF421 domain-containing protein [Bacillus benzoevorans]MBB6445905.1 uncharacterized membrane protein YcaP (DUF421 family) [Bacillus benzoevorans]
MNDIWTMILRTLLLYFVILFVFRLMGKREIGELSVFDLVVNIMIAEMAVMAIDEKDFSLAAAVVPIFLLMIIQIGMARLSLKSKKFRDLIDGSPTIIINKGEIDEEAMKKQRYNFDDLLQQLREKDVRNISDVEFAILEPSGKLSVFERENSNKDGDITLPLIIDGIIQQDHLERIQKTEDWLRKELQKKGFDQKDIHNISFCSYQNNQFYIDTFHKE